MPPLRLTTLALILTFAAPAFAQVTDGTETLRLGPYISPVWTDGLVGRIRRDFRPDGLTVHVQTREGGFDTAFATSYETTTTVGAMHPDYAIRATWTVSGTGDGYWFVGPKIGVGWTDAPGTPGWFENYIIVNSGFSPADWHRMALADGGAYLGETRADGHRYRHYRKPYGTWTQFLAVRQTYGSGGTVSVGRILSFWRAHGLPDRKIDHVRLNIETGGQIDRVFAISDIVLPVDFAAAPGAAHP